MFIGGVLLTAAVVTWAIGLMMSPHTPSVSEGTEHVRNVIVTFVRNTAIGTLVLSALSGWLLFPNPRPKMPLRDYAILALIGVLVLTSLYQLYWLYSLTAQ
jgi:drug/metabolite transporter (DMT)-like permease